MYFSFSQLFFMTGIHAYLGIQVYTFLNKTWIQFRVSMIQHLF